MAGYDPQKARGRHEIPDDEPAPVDGLLGPAPEIDGDGPTLAHDAGRPMVRQVLPVPPAVPADEPETVDEIVIVTDEVVTDEVVADEITIDETTPDIEPEPVIPAPEPRATPTASAAPVSSPAAPSSRVRIAAVVAAVVALVLLVLWRRRRH